MHVEFFNIRFILIIHDFIYIRKISLLIYNIDKYSKCYIKIILVIEMLLWSDQVIIYDSSCI